VIGGLLVGLFAIFSIAYLSWQLMKTYNNQTIDEGSRIVRTAVIGFGYTVQLAILVWLSTAGGAFAWFREQAPAKADTPYVIGISVGIFLGAGALHWIVSRRKFRP
jgi:hypothetical protein